MRLPLLAAVAIFSWFSCALGQGVSQAEPTLPDLAGLLGAVTVIEVELPAATNSFRVVYTTGEDDQFEISGPVRAAQGGGARTMRLLLLAPGRQASSTCEGEPVDALIEYADGGSGRTALCVPLPESSAGRTHEFVLSGPTPEFDAWAPVYVRAWSPVEMGAPGSGSDFDLAHALTIQLLLSAAEYENLGTDRALSAEELLRHPEIEARNRRR